MENINVVIDSKWVKLINSPLYTIVQALTGVSISFAPLFLYFAGEWRLRGSSMWLTFIACYGIIFLVSAFYFGLALSVIKQIRKMHSKQADHAGL
jgi:ABC-type nickel/cobalt efflux system permease component RcnA